MERKERIASLEKQGINISKIESVLSHDAAPGGSLSIISGHHSQTETISFGYYDDHKNDQVKDDTMYDLASVTKLYTTALVLRLQERGKLSIYDLCSKYLANFENTEIQLVDLLTHRVNFGIQLSDYRNRFPDTFEEEIIKIKPPHKRSEVVNYENLGFLYLGKIISLVEGKDLDVTARELVDSLNLQATQTGVEIRESKYLNPPTEQTGETVVQGETHDESARLLGGLAGNAGMFATAQDLALFGNCWLNGEIVSPQTLKDIAFKNYDTSGKKPQALGWWMRIPTINGEKFISNVYSHTGFTGSILAVNPESHKICAFTCNRTYYGRGNQKHREIWELLAEWVSK